MAGKPNRSGRKSLKHELDFNMLGRYSLAYLLRQMRSDKAEPRTKLKISLEVVGKMLGKPVLNIDQSEHKHITYVWEEGNNTLQTPEVPEGNSRLKGEVQGTLLGEKSREDSIQSE